MYHVARVRGAWGDLVDGKEKPFFDWIRRFWWATLADKVRLYVTLRSFAMMSMSGWGSGMSASTALASAGVYAPPIIAPIGFGIAFFTLVLSVVLYLAYQLEKRGAVWEPVPWRT